MTCITHLPCHARIIIIFPSLDPVPVLFGCWPGSGSICMLNPNPTSLLIRHSYKLEAPSLNTLKTGDLYEASEIFVAWPQGNCTLANKNLNTNYPTLMGGMCLASWLYSRAVGSTVLNGSSNARSFRNGIQSKENYAKQMCRWWPSPHGSSRQQQHSLYSYFFCNCPLSNPSPNSLSKLVSLLPEGLASFGFIHMLKCLWGCVLCLW